LDSDFPVFLLPLSGFRNKLSRSVLGQAQKVFAAAFTKTKTRGRKPCFSVERAPVSADAGGRTLRGGQIRSIFVGNLGFTLVMIGSYNRKDTVGLFPILAIRKYILFL
jgi:hypothetical protein